MNTSIQTATSSQLVNTFTAMIGNIAQLAVDARELHTFLQSKQDFSTWIKGRLRKYGFVENMDYLLHKFVEQLPSGAKHLTDYHLTLDTAKELSMVENNEQGRLARRYFIDMEKKALATLLAPMTAVKGISQQQYQELEKTVKHIAQAFKYAKATRLIWALLRQQTGMTARYLPVNRFDEAKQHLQTIQTHCENFHQLMCKGEAVQFARYKAFFDLREQAELAFLKQNVDLVPVPIQLMLDQLT